MTRKPVTEEQVRRIVDRWQPRLGIMDWDITIEIGGLPKSDYGRTFSRDDDFRGRIQINDKPWEVAETRGSIGTGTLEETVVHELLHIASSHLREMLFVIIDSEIGGATGKVWELRIRDEEEKMIDKLAINLVRSWK